MAGAFINTLLQVDREIWQYINVAWQNPMLDTITPYLRNQYFWTPLYLFLAIFMPLKFGRNGWIWCAAFLLTFAISDYTSASIIKPYVQRLRPCNDPGLKGIVHIIVNCGSGYSFPSSHAANHFSLAVFMSATLHKKYKWVWPAALFWAFIVAYSQVYVGVHYPLDVFCGALLGICAGFITGKLFNRRKTWRHIIQPPTDP